MKYLFSIFLSLTVFCIYGQEKFFYPSVDSIQLNYRSGGYQLDSIDGSFIGQLTLRPGAGFEEIYEEKLATNLFSSTSGVTFFGTKHKVIPKFSGLPYLGFKYAFGSSLTQDLNVEYHQYYSNHTHLHLQYRRQTSDGLLRNGNYKLNDLSILFFHSKKWWTTNVSGYYGRYDMGQNGGITTDSLLADFATLYTPVAQEDANSKVRKLAVDWDNYFRLIGDSIVGTGLATHHSMHINNREYADPTIAPPQFDTLFLDTTGTRDQFQMAEMANGAGVYFNSPYFKIDGTINYTYRRFQNSGKNRDTSELFLYSHLWASLGKKIALNNTFYFNVLGAIGELKNNARLSYQPFKNLSITARVNFENVYPEPFQRQYTSNYYKWKISKMEMQQKLQFSGSIKWGDSNFIGASVVWSNISNGRYFIGNQWRQDTLKLVSVGALHAFGGIHVGKFALYPSVTVRFSSANFNYQPLFSTMNRISFTTKLFKAQKLGFSIGADVGYSSAYNTLRYNGVLGLMEIDPTATISKSRMRLNAFLALAIDQFRFFVRAENLSALYTDPTYRIDPNYPIMPFVMRIGITWDFFN